MPESLPYHEHLLSESPAILMLKLCQNVYIYCCCQNPLYGQTDPIRNWWVVKVEGGSTLTEVRCIVFKDIKVEVTIS